MSIQHCFPRDFFPNAAGEQNLSLCANRAFALEPAQQADSECRSYSQIAVSSPPLRFVADLNPPTAELHLYWQCVRTLSHHLPGLPAFFRPSSISSFPLCETVSLPLWKPLAMETLMLKTRHLRRKKPNWSSGMQTARAKPRSGSSIVKSLMTTAMFSSKPVPKNCSFHPKYWHSLLQSSKQCSTHSFGREVPFEVCRIRSNSRCQMTSQMPWPFFFTPCISRRNEHPSNLEPICSSMLPSYRINTNAQPRYPVKVDVGCVR